MYPAVLLMYFISAAVIRLASLALITYTLRRNRLIGNIHVIMHNCSTPVAVLIIAER